MFSLLGHLMSDSDCFVILIRTCHQVINTRLSPPLAHTHIAHHALCRFSSALFGMRNVHVRAAVADTKRPLGTLISTREKEREIQSVAHIETSAD